jgi:NADPH:quinone reductase-like Zn-dependent oxidoreductase
MPTETMRAATARRYGPPEVMALEAVPRPDHGRGQVRVRVAAFGVTRGDARIRGLDAPGGMRPIMRLIFGLTGPRRPIPGREFAGVVEAVGDGVTGFVPGDAVFGITDGLTLGAGAEYVVASAAKLVFPRPPGMTAPEAAAFLFGGLTAADFLLDQAQLRAGERVLVLGATGAVGSAMVQIARHAGAVVTAVAGAANLDVARDLGAAAAHDYANGLPAGPFDVIADIPGVLDWTGARPRLAPGGRFCRVTADLPAMLGAMLRPRRAGRRLCVAPIRETREAVARLLAIHADGGYRPVLGAVLPLERIVEAHRLASGGHKRGNVVVTLA